MARSFSLGPFSVGGFTSLAGLVIGERVIPVMALQPLREALGKPLSAPETVFGLLLAWERNAPVLQASVAGLDVADTATVESLALETVKVHAPMLYPRQIFCAGANYRQHVIDIVVAESRNAGDTTSLEQRRAQAAHMMDARIATGSPYVFTKIPSAITGPYDAVVLPADSAQPDWELELGVIIGRAARHVTRDEALSYVAGYTIVNDLTSRDKVYRPDLKAIGTDWLLSKSSPGFLPMGPYMLPAAFVPDPQHLPLIPKLNGQVMQDEGTDDMIFGVAR